MTILIVISLLFSVEWNCVHKRYFDNNGRPLVGGKVYFYSAGTSSPETVYHDNGENATTNPVVLNSSGSMYVCGDMYKSYGIRITDNDGYPVQGDIGEVSGHRGSSYYFAGTVIYDTIRLAPKTDIVHDTIHSIDTVRLAPTVVHDTVNRIDTHVVVDTLKVVQRDTLVKIDTLNTCRDGTFSRYYEEPSVSKGTSAIGSPITVESIPGSSPSIGITTNINVDIEVYVYDNLGVSVASGTYTVRSSTAKQYVTFNGYTKNGIKVPNGVYLMRIVSGHNGTVSNNVYRIGIDNRMAE